MSRHIVPPGFWMVAGLLLGCWLLYEAGRAFLTGKVHYRVAGKEVPFSRPSLTYWSITLSILAGGLGAVGWAAWGIWRGVVGA